MAATIGNLTARVLIQYGDQEPTELFTVEAPMLVTGPTEVASVGIDMRRFLRNLRRAFRAAARAIR